jgi:hypothetical protein
MPLLNHSSPEEKDGGPFVSQNAADDDTRFASEPVSLNARESPLGIFRHLGPRRRRMSSTNLLMIKRPDNGRPPGE